MLNRRPCFLFNQNHSTRHPIRPISFFFLARPSLFGATPGLFPLSAPAAASVAVLARLVTEFSLERRRNVRGINGKLLVREDGGKEGKKYGSLLVKMGET